VYAAALRIGGGWSGADTVADLQTSTAVYLAADVVSVAAGVLVVLVVGRRTRRQEARAERLAATGPGRTPHPEAGGSREG
jgi:hypothetical protein